MHPVQPDTVEFAYADFHGGRNATAPLTWGQRAMWRSVAEFPNQPVLSLRRILTVPRRVPADVPTVTRAIGMLLTRHESLRTRIRPANGQLQQVASTVGRLPLRLVTVPATDTDPDGQSVAGMLADRLSDPPFDHAEEWPLRVGLVVVDDRVRQIVIVFSHATVDAYATEIVLRDLRLLLLRGKLPSGPGLQSVDVARREQQTERWRSDRAVAYWVRQFRLLPAGVFDPVGPPLRPRYRSGRLVSAAIDTAARLIAARHRVSTGTVLLAAIAQLVTARSGRDVCGLLTMANNRFHPEYGDAVAKLNQIGLCRLDLTDRPDFTELLSRARHASLDGYRHAYYDPAAMERAFAELGHDYGTALAPFCYVNDIRLPSEPGATVGRVDEAMLRAAPAYTRFTWSEPLDRFDWRCRIQVVDAPGATELLITFDTRYLLPQHAESLLREVEELLVRIACHEVPSGGFG